MTDELDLFITPSYDEFCGRDLDGLLDKIPAGISLVMGISDSDYVHFDGAGEIGDPSYDEKEEQA